MNKELIRSRFEKHLDDYNENAKVQKIMAKKLVYLCGKKKYKNILELGCGTGLLTREAVENLEFENYTAIDIVPNCENYIKQIDKNIEFKHLEIESFKDFSKYDLVISNAAMQWVADFEKTVRNIFESMQVGSELIFTTFGKENFREIFYILGTSLSYYSEEELKAIFPEISEILAEIHVMSFKTPKDVLNHLKLTGVNAVESHHWTKNDLKMFEQAYSSLCVRVPILTYNPIYIKIQK